MRTSEQLCELREVIEFLQVGDELFWEPLRLQIPEPWCGHIPVAFWLVKAVQPRLVVELGTHSGNSYSAFCQAIDTLQLPARAFAVDTWAGDEHAGFYDESVYEELNRFNDNHFAAFSSLLRTTFDNARTRFSDGSIDILHIDGLHTYEAVRHDFDTWSSAASSSAVVIFHDINVREREFGVWKLWMELSECYPSFEFHHCEGLGVLGLGTKQTPLMGRLFEIAPDSVASCIVRRVFSARGETFRQRVRVIRLNDQNTVLQNDNSVLLRDLQLKDRYIQEQEQRTAAMERGYQQALEARALERQELLEAYDKAAREISELVRVKDELGLKNDELLSQVRAFQQQIRERDDSRQALQASLSREEQRRAELEGLLTASEQRRAELEGLLTASEQRLRQVKADSANIRAQLQSVLHSRAWKYTAKARKLLTGLGSLKSPRMRKMRQAVASSGLFDQQWYLQQYPDVAVSCIDPLTHFLEFGAAELRDPGPEFSSAEYVTRYPDVRAAAMNPLVHYLEFGKTEGRQKFPVPKSAMSVEPARIESVAAPAVVQSVVLPSDFTDVFPYMSTPIDKASLPRELYIGASSLGNFFMSEIGKILQQAFLELGVKATLVTEVDALTLPPASTVVVVAPHEFFPLGDGPKAYEFLAQSCHLVMVNTEQPQTPWFALAKSYFEKAITILDINFEAARHIRALGFPALALPLGYSTYIAGTYPGTILPEHELWRFIPPERIAPYPTAYADRPIDLLFIGTTSERRNRFFGRHAAFFASKETIIYMPIGNTPFLPEHSRTVDFSTLIALIRRSKILLNIHRDDSSYLEWQRIVTLGIMQKTLVISDTCDRTPCLVPNLDYLEGPLDALPMLCEFALSNAHVAERFANTAHARLQQTYPMDQILGRCWTAMVKGTRSFQ